MWVLTTFYLQIYILGTNLMSTDNSNFTCESLSQQPHHTITSTTVLRIEQRPRYNNYYILDSDYFLYTRNL